MGTRTATRTGLYLYAIIDDRGDRVSGAIGIDDRPLYSITDGHVAAVVSDMPDARIRPERRKLAAHQQVLKTLMEEHTVLPMSFGIVADGAESVQKILSLNHAALGRQLKRLAGKLEMGLRVSWDAPNIFEYFVGTHPRLRALRDDLFGGGAQPSRDDMIELGRLFDVIVKEDRAVHTRKVICMLRSRCCEIKENDPRTEREVMNLACLIGREAREEFEKGVLEAAGLFDNNFAFDFNGPWPPYNFVDVQLEMP